VIEMLGVALGLGALAGVNLYMTVFVTGLALRLGWLDLLTGYSELEVLANPWVLGISGVLFLLEACADKVPWVDSAWDVVHTVIRPVGGVLLAMGALGQLDPALTVVAGLLTGGTSLITHTAKAGTRAMINLSPEPVSNLVASTAEDTFVLGGLSLVALAPMPAFFVFLVVVVIAAIVVWKTSRFLVRGWQRLRQRGVVRADG